jgi:hypothetical protein
MVAAVSRWTASQVKLSVLRAVSLPLESYVFVWAPLTGSVMLVSRSLAS